jgi:23S rRNA-/tRNA-specific pseudouridylate synthase
MTGRTNQIRIHLWDLGYPIDGDPMYQAGGRLGERQTLRVEEPPLCLQSHRIEFEHPITGRRVSFQAPLPSWFETTSRV